LTNGIGTLSNYEMPLLTQSLAPYVFLTPTNLVSIPAILSSNQAARIYHQSNPDRLGISLANAHFVMESDAKNVFGLGYLSVRTAYGSSNGVEFLDISPGGTVLANGDYFYPAISQPILRTVDYYFGRQDVDPFPGSLYFDPTNTTPLMIISGNNPFFAVDEFGLYSRVLRIAGYAKQAIDNGDTNKFAYLGLYFDKAYKVNLNGTISTNETGILSEYGEFFPTEPGRVVLATKPEAVGETNIGGVLVHTVKLELDVNHDGIIDRSITGPDNTSYYKPFVFWINNDNDGISGAGQDSEFGGDYADGKISSERDLEDFARLWISGLPSLPSSEGYSVTLGWSEFSSDVKIKIYPAVEIDGGIGYLTNSTAASQQMTVYSGQISPGQTLAEISLSSPFTFPTNYFDGSRKHFLFEGSAPGYGELILTINKNGQPIGSTLVFIEIKDIKDLYEQVSAENVRSDFPPSALTSQFKISRPLAANGAETKQTIVFIHGINNTEWEARNTAETMFKRLYWSGYQGRFTAFRWPSPLLPDCSLSTGLFRGSVLNYNKGEYIAFKSANALKNYLQDSTNRLPDYAINVYGHSMGGIVASEALRLGAPFNNCILSQAAVPAHCYDVNAPFVQKFLDAEQTPNKATPFTAAQGGYHGYFTNITGNIVNFYNEEDFALVLGTCPGFGETNWEKNHVSQKPESFLFSSTFYGYNTNTAESSVSVIFNNMATVRTLTDSYEKKAMVARTRSKAVGAKDSLGGVIAESVNLQSSSLGTFGNSRPEHSAQFNRNIQSVIGYYQAIRLQIQPQ